MNYVVTLTITWIEFSDSIMYCLKRIMKKVKLIRKKGKK